jgi:hypothetical protein
LKGANKRVGRLDQVRIGDTLDTNITGAMHDGRAHHLAP